MATLPGAVLVVFVALVCLLAGSVPAFAAPSEYEVKAAFLYNFTRYIDWPPSAFSGDNAPFVIGILGNDPFGNFLTDAVNGKDMDGRPFVVRHFAHTSDIQSCQMLFVSASAQGQMESVVAHLGKSDTVLVGDSRGFLSRGGTINFFISSQRVHFEINPDAAERVGVKISSRLLALAKIVRL
jgi:hypothetical protein